MLDLATVSETADTTVLAVTGWATGPSVSLLEQELTRLMALDRKVVLELSAIRFIDEAGLDLLEGWVRDGMALAGGHRSEVVPGELPQMLVPAAQEPVRQAAGLWLYFPYGAVPGAPAPTVRGGDTFIPSYEEGLWTGTFDGISTEIGQVVRHSSGSMSFNSTITIEGSVEGQSGTLVMEVAGTVPPGGTGWAGTWVLLSGTGALADVRGHGDWWGPGYAGRIGVPGPATVDCGFEVDVPAEDPWYVDEDPQEPPPPWPGRPESREYGQICYSGSLYPWVEP